MLDELLADVRGQPAADALAALLARWPGARRAALAEAIVLLDRRAAHEAFAGSVPERIAGWNAALDGGEVGRAIAAFPIGLIADAEAQIERLAALADPRVGERVVQLLADPPYRSPASRGFWQRAFAVVVASGDARACALLRARREAFGRVLAHPMREWGPRDLGDALAEAPAPEAIPEAWRGYHEALARALVSDARAEDLLAAIYDAPHDRARRLVYADRLVELGDDRGELIGLQLAREAGGRVSAAARKREKELLARHARPGLGELAPVILKSGLGYAGGFPDACELKAKSADQLEPLIGHPAWSTVRSIHVAEMSHTLYPRVDRLLLHPVMRSLRVLDGHSTRERFRELCLGDVERPLHTLVHGQLSMSPSMGWMIGRGWTQLPPEGPTFVPEEQRALTECPGLPALADLDICGAYHRVPPRFLRWFLDGALCRRLDRLHIRTDEGLVGEWIAALADHPLPELVVTGEDGGRYTLVRDERGRMSRMSVWLRPCNVFNCFRGDEHMSQFNDFLRLLAGVEPGVLTRLEIGWNAKEAPTAEQRDRLASLLSRDPSLDVTHPA
jgi:uncharacterized protein (TIGR02996 family)